MILKLKQNDSWRFIDNIQEIVTPATKEISPKEIFIQYTKNGEILNQNVSEGCYILNDLGKTIERLV